MNIHHWRILSELGVERHCSCLDDLLVQKNHVMLLHNVMFAVEREKGQQSVGRG